MIKLYTDAAYLAKNQTGGMGIIIDYGERILLKYHRDGVEDNHLLEFQAVLLGLEYVAALNLPDERIVSLYSDSKIVMASIEKRYCKDLRYRAYLQPILDHLNRYDMVFTQWIADKENKGADQLARQALHYQGQVIVVNEHDPIADGRS